jgi:hypothetical protein
MRRALKKLQIIDEGADGISTRDPPSGHNVDALDSIGAAL